LTSTYSVIVGNIFIEYLDEHIVADILNFDVISLVPLGSFSRILLDGRLECLLPVVDNAEGVHLSKELSITGQTCLDNSET